MSEQAANENTKLVENATCTFCGCVCDDMMLTVDMKEKRITKAKNACVLGRAWFAEHYIEEDAPPALIDGKPATVEDAVEEAAQTLVKARFPITYGLSDTTCEAQRQAVAIADLLRGCIDTTTSVCHGPTGLAFQGVGESTMTLGEVKNRADLVIYWGGNPAESHPRHFGRYAVTAKGMFTPQGKKDRTVVVVDVRRTPSAPAANQFIQVKPGRDFELLWALRALVKNRKVNPDVEAITGVSVETMEALVEKMKTCRYGALFLGMGLTMTRGRHFNSGAALALATDLNEYTHFVAKPVRGHGNVTGADNVMSWQTGYPFGVNYSRGFPRFNPGEFTTRGRAWPAPRTPMPRSSSPADPAANFPQRRHPSICGRIPGDRARSPVSTHTSRLARVAFTHGSPTASVPPGTVYRMDDVPITLRPALEVTTSRATKRC